MGMTYMETSNIKTDPQTKLQLALSKIGLTSKGVTPILSTMYSLLAFAATKIQRRIHDSSCTTFC